MNSVTTHDPASGRVRTMEDQTYRRLVEITGDPVSGRVESCRIHVRGGEVASKVSISEDIRAELDAGGRVLTILVLGFPGEPADFDLALQKLGLEQADRCYIMGAMPVYFTS